MHGSVWRKARIPNAVLCIIIYMFFICEVVISGQAKASIEQLQLALTWNRSDVAEDKLFNQENMWPEGK